MPKEKKPITTKRGQHHKFKSFTMNLVKDNSIEKVDTNVLRKHQLFEKKKVTFEKRNSDPAHFQGAIIREFPSLSGVEFSLWRLSKDNPTLIPLSSDINNAVALCGYEELNRSKLYIRLMAAPSEVPSKVCIPSGSAEPESYMPVPSDDEGEESEQQDDSNMEFMQQSVPIFQNVVKFHQTGDNGNDYNIIEMQPPATEVFNYSQVSTNLQQSDFMFQDGANYGVNCVVDHPLNSDALNDNFGTGNERKRKHFPDSENYVPSKSAIATEEDDCHEVARFMASFPTHEPNVSSLGDNNYYITSTISQSIPLPHQSTFSTLCATSECANFTQPHMSSQFLHTSLYTGRDPNILDTGLPLNFDDLLTRQVPSSNEVPACSVQNMNFSSGSQQHPGFQMTSEQISHNDACERNCGLSSEENLIKDKTEVPKAELIGEVKDCRSYIIGISVLKEKLYIIYRDSDTLTIHSSSSPFEKFNEPKIGGMKMPVQISASSNKNCLYILDGKNSELKCIWIVTDSDEFTAKKLLEDVSCCSLAVTNEGDLVVLDNKNRCLRLYKSENSRCFRCIHLKAIWKEEFGEPHFVICSVDNHFYISSSDEKTCRSMICKVSDEGKLLKTYGGRSGEGLGQLSSSNCHLLTLDKYGRVIVCGSRNHRALLLNSNLEHMTTVFGKKLFRYGTFAMCCDDSDCLFMLNRWKFKVFDISQFTPDILKKIAHQKSLKNSNGNYEMHLMGSIFTEVKSPGSIRGVAVLFDKIYLLTSKNIFVHSALNPYKQIHSERNRWSFANIWDIAADNRGVGRLYVTDKAYHCIWWMGIDLNKKKWLQKTGSPYTLSISKDGSVIIPNNKLMSVDIYEGKTAELMQRISLSPNLIRRKLRHAVKLGDGFVICFGCIGEEFDDMDDDTFINDILLISSNGRVVRSYCDINKDQDKLHLPNHLTIDRRGRVLVANWKYNRVLSLNKQLNLKKTLLSSWEQGISEPRRLCYDEKSDRLLVCCSQSVDIFRCSGGLLLQTVDQVPLLAPNCPDSDNCSFQLPSFSKIHQMTDHREKDRSCRGVAILFDELYLIYKRVESVYVHQSHPPFDFLREIHIMKLNDCCYTGLAGRCRPSVVASSVQNRCYIKAFKKIWYLTSGSHTAELFLESEDRIHSISVTASGEVLVVYQDGKFAVYNVESECIEYVFVNRTDDKSSINHGVKTSDGRFIYADIAYNYYGHMVAIYERSADGKESCIFGPFECGDKICRPFSFSEIILGEDGQMFMLEEKGENLLLYDYRANVLRTRVIKDDLQVSKITGFCYSREKKQLLLICKSEGIVFLQLSQNDGRGLESSINRRDLFEHEDEEKKSDRLLYSSRCEMYQNHLRRPIKGIARLEQHTYILDDSQLWTLDSKGMRVKSLDDKMMLNTFQIPEDGSNLKTGGLRDIAASHVDLCLYITDGKNRCIWSVTIDDELKRWSKEDIDSPFTLSINDEGDVIVPSNFYKHLDVFDSNGIRKRSIRLPRHMIYVIRAVQTPTGNFLILWSEGNLDDDANKSEDDSKNDDDDDDDESENDDCEKRERTNKTCKMDGACKDRLSEIDSEGKLLRTINSVELIPFPAEPVKLRHLTIDPGGRIFVFDISSKGRVLLLDNQLKVLENLNKKPLMCRRYSEINHGGLCYDRTTKDLLVSVEFKEFIYGSGVVACIKV